MGSTVASSLIDKLLERDFSLPPASFIDKAPAGLSLIVPSLIALLKICLQYAKTSLAIDGRSLELIFSTIARISRGSAVFIDRASMTGELSFSYTRLGICGFFSSRSQTFSHLLAISSTDMQESLFGHFFSAIVFRP